MLSVSLYALMAAPGAHSEIGGIGPVNSAEEGTATEGSANPSSGATDRSGSRLVSPSRGPESEERLNSTIEEQFDLLPVATTPGAPWIIEGEVNAVGVAPIPNAVNRSLRFDVGKGAEACVVLDTAVQTVRVTVDISITDATTSDAILLRAGSNNTDATALTINDGLFAFQIGGTRLVTSVVPIPDGWYRAGVLIDLRQSALELSLAEGDGRDLFRHDGPMAVHTVASIDRICFGRAGADAAVRWYLDNVVIEE